MIRSSRMSAFKPSPVCYIQGWKPTKYSEKEMTHCPGRFWGIILLCVFNMNQFSTVSMVPLPFFF